MDFFRKKGRADDFKMAMSGKVKYSTVLDNRTIHPSDTVAEGAISDHSISNEKTTLQASGTGMLEKTFWAISRSIYFVTYKGMTAKLIAEQLGEAKHCIDMDDKSKKRIH